MSKPFDMEPLLLLANVVRHDRISRDVRIVLVDLWEWHGRFLCGWLRDARHQ